MTHSDLLLCQLLFHVPRSSSCERHSHLRLHRIRSLGMNLLIYEIHILSTSKTNMICFFVEPFLAIQSPPQSLAETSHLNCFLALSSY